MKTFEGNLTSTNSRIGIVVARFNHTITAGLLGGALDGLRRHGINEDDIHVAWVPGAFEIPLVATRMAHSGAYDAVICLGAVIKGSTNHYDYVCAQTAAGIADASVTTGVPVLFGVLTTDTIEQAIERSGTKLGNKGFECATDAIEMISLMRALDDTLAAGGQA